MSQITPHSPSTGRQQRRSPFVAAGLSLIAPGLGQVYNTRVRRGLIVMAACATFIMAFLIILKFRNVGAVFGFVPIFYPNATVFLLVTALPVLVAGLYAYSVIGAFFGARAHRTPHLGQFNRGSIYMGLMASYLGIVLTTYALSYVTVYMDPAEREKARLDRLTSLVTFAGTDFLIPNNYIVSRRNRVDGPASSISLEAYLPDLRSPSYVSEEERNIKGWGTVVRIYLRGVAGRQSVDDIVNNYERSGTVDNSNIDYQSSSIQNITTSRSTLDDYFLVVTNGKISLFINCSKIDPLRSPECNVNSKFRKNDLLTVSFSREYFDDIPGISSKVVNLLEEFVLSATKTQLKE